MRTGYFLAVLLLMSSFFIHSAAAAEQTGEVIVSAAASLQNAFVEIGRFYESRNKGIKISFNFGASGDLMRQIEGGAPVDVFASAAGMEMDEIQKKGLILSASRVDFAANTVVLITRPGKAWVKSFQDLNAAGIKRIAVGNPRTVPAGRYAEEVFNYFNILDSARDKLVLTENVRQALDYVARGEVDAGVVYATDAMMRPKEISIVAVAPDRSHTLASYPVAVVQGTKNETAARAFIMLLLSPEGKNILAKYGFKKR